MGRAQLRTLLPLILLSCACSDENPLDVHQIGPAEYLAPNTGLNCGSDCLPDDVASAWQLFGSPPAYSHYTYSGIQDPTTAGG